MRRRLLAVMLLAAAPALAEEGSTGAWTWRLDMKPDGSGMSNAFSPAPVASYNDPGYVIARCFGGRTEFMVGTNGGWGVSGQTITVETQAGDAPATTAQWNVSTNGKAVFAPDPVEDFAKTIPDPGKLRVAVKDNTGETRETVFDMTGFATVREKLAQACRWPK